MCVSQAIAYHKSRRRPVTALVEGSKHQATTSTGTAVRVLGESESETDLAAVAPLRSGPRDLFVPGPGLGETVRRATPH